MRICQNGPLDKFMRSSTLCIVTYGAIKICGTNLCDLCLTCTICINKSHNRNLSLCSIYGIYMYLEYLWVVTGQCVDALLRATEYICISTRKKTTCEVCLIVRCALTTCKIAESKWHQCSPQHTQGMSAQQAFSTDYLLMWEWEECNSFDVANGSTQILSSSHALGRTPHRAMHGVLVEGMSL